MFQARNDLTRREVLASTLSAGLFAAGARYARAADPPADQALIAISLDLEMSRNFPAWEDTHWDFEKGNLDQDTKRYAVEAARRVKAKGGRIHFFALGQTFEQENVDWLREIIEQGHPVGNHTYDHVYVKATKPEDVQFRFKRAPWLIEGKTPAEAVAANIRMAGAAMKHRVGIEPAGFRTPGGFFNGISDRPDVQELLLKLGYHWVSSKYPAHPASPPGQAPSAELIQGVVAAQAQAQPFVYPSGLIEVPMSPVSDINAFRTGRWPLESFLETIRSGVSWAIENRATFDFLAHPSCLTVADPKFRTIDMICEMVEKAGSRAALTDLGTIAQRAKANTGR
ncbi:polysaccharide deacetylase family protein [Singulisphaera acidiphila]|uniref:Putative xylanase/chitin deacetylase n=1 Tax=Singulisphaera acidiphila (strain ATCC BAA-1392 / DSM 18658 / VKM B-2454 / MOB10) TaxID=886293 RepID=L0DP38_SINAD|nr:polysaccharide deacetylase family protein [Singulisphaera acidiphila]AGA31022.1 putative xylanase/chitin deacetylase [Singulisphaera acidiphila DSM 18658]